MWTPRRLRRIGHAAAVRNARQACLMLEVRRREREEVEAFLAGWQRGPATPSGAA